VTRATNKEGREVVRERQWLAGLPHHVAGQRIYVDAFCRDEEEQSATWSAALVFSRIIQDLGAQPVLSRSADTDPTERVRALRANREAVDLVVSFAMAREEQAVYYFSSAHSSSAAGASIAAEVAACLGVETRGRSIPMLKNTRSPAIVVAVTPMDEQVGGRTAQGLINLFARDGA
jgi:hypothetical protein